MKGVWKKMDFWFEDKPILQLVIISISLFSALFLVSVFFKDNSEKFQLWTLIISSYSFILFLALNLNFAPYSKKHIALLEKQIELLREQNALMKNINIVNEPHENQTENKK